MQKIQPNSRQIPNKKEITAQPKYNDLVYAWFQANSSWDEDQSHPRYISKRDASFTRIGKDVGMSRQTVSKKVALLQELGLLILNEQEKMYEIVILDKDVAFLIENRTLEILVSAMNQNAITCYVYLYCRYCANKCKPFKFYMDQLRAMTGMSTSNRDNNTFKNILLVLQKLELLKFSLVNDGDVRTVYQIDWMTNKINC